MSLFNLKNIPNPKWNGDPENFEATGITGTVASQTDADTIDIALTGLNDGFIVSRCVALNATTGAVIQATDLIVDAGGTNKIRFTSDDTAGMVYADGYTVNLLIIFTNGAITVVKNTKA